jgi:hypothetical protein
MAKGNAPINSPLTELNPRMVVAKRKHVTRNHDEIVRDEEGSGYAQYDLDAFWSDHKDE